MSAAGVSAALSILKRERRDFNTVNSRSRRRAIAQRRSRPSAPSRGPRAV